MSIDNDIHVIKELIRELVDLHKEKTPFKTIDTLIHDAKKAKTKIKVKAQAIEKPKAKKEEKPKEELKPVVKKELTADDVKQEARKLVDGFKTSRKGFEKAQQILRKFGAPSLEALLPEKYVGVVNAFRDAVKKFGG